MPQPPAYARQGNFTLEQQQNPTTKTPGVTLDAEYNAIKATLDAALANLARIQRDDGALANVSVGLTQLKPELVIGIKNPLPWVTAQAYALNDVVWQSNTLYLCLVAHTSGTFATDLAANRWVSFLDYNDPLGAAQAAANAAQASQTAAAGSASAAATSATAAAASATDAAASAAAAAALANVIGFPVAVGSGGTGATTQSGARANLGLAPSAADKILYGASNTTLAETDFTAFARTLLDDANAAAARTTLEGTSIGQALFTAPNALTARTSLGINVSDNRIINGRMEIDQRNAGAAVTVNANAAFRSVDMYLAFGENADGVYTLQQQAGGPPGFSHFLRATVTTADASIGAAQRYVFGLRIEGTNVRDLGWGTANAQAITIRRWVRSTVAGTYGFIVTNSAASRTYGGTFTINAANTWELKTITIPGDTSGTWLTDTGVGMQVLIDLGSGASLRGSSGVWNGSVLYPSGTVSLISTLNATFDVTGEELVRASSDLGPSWRPFAQELALCQRYYWQTISVAADAYTASGGVGILAWVRHPVTMRAGPTITQNGAVVTSSNVASTTFGASGAGYSDADQTTLSVSSSAAGRAFLYRPVQFSAEL